MFDKKKYMEQWRKNNPEKLKKYRENHFEYYKQYGEIWRRNNPEYNKQYTKLWKENNPEKRKENDSQYRERNRKEIRRRNKLFYKNNQEKLIKQTKRYYENNKEEMKKYKNQWHKNKWKSDLRFNLNRRMGFAMWIVLKNNKAGRKWEDLVGYTINDLIKHLKKTMPKGYTWQDYLEGKLHIDHKIPKSVFNFTKPEHIDFKRCWALSNLQLLPAKENLIKHNKLYKPFQPALQI